MVAVLEGSVTRPRVQFNRSLRTVFLTGLGTALPEARVSNQQIAEALGCFSADDIEARTGICQRRFASSTQTTSDLAIEAGRAALQHAELDADAVDLILLATASPDHLMPATACRVQHGLGAGRAAAMDLVAACSGFLYALWTGQQFVQTGQANCVLVIGAEVMSRIVDPTDRQCAMLFGDGAGAVVLTAAEGRYRLGRCWARTWGEHYSCLLRPGGTAPAEGPALGAGSGSFLRMDGRRVFRAAVEGFTQAIAQTAAANGLGLQDLDWIVPHQANARIFTQVADQMGIPLERFWLNLDQYGNTCAASVPLALADLYRERLLRPGDRLLLAGVGAGITAAGAALFVE